MQYVPCGDSAFRQVSNFCCERDCFRSWGIDDLCQETYDVRDGTTCTIDVLGCPC